MYPYIIQMNPYLKLATKVTKLLQAGNTSYGLVSIPPPIDSGIPDLPFQIVLKSLNKQGKFLLFRFISLFSADKHL